MGRKSIAQKIVENLPKHDITDQEYLVCYDFIGDKAGKVFYPNLHRITALTGGDSGLIQFSVYRTRSLKAVLAVHALAVRDGAEVQVYAVSEARPGELLEKLEEAQAHLDEVEGMGDG